MKKKLFNCFFSLVFFFFYLILIFFFKTKRHSMGLIPTKESLEMASQVNASRFCRRRLPLVMVRNKMSQSIQAAVKFVEQGHVRVGPERVTDPAFLVSRKLEDYVTWTDTSAIRRQIEEYNGMVRLLIINLI